MTETTGRLTRADLESRLRAFDARTVPLGTGARPPS